MARTKKTLPLRALASGVIRKADTAGRRYGSLTVEAWPKVAGDEIARHTRGFALRDNQEFVVFVDGAAWANQLSLMSEDLRQRLNTHLGDNAVKTLRFTVSRAVAEATTREGVEQAAEEYYTPEVPDPAPLDEVELEQAKHVATAVRDAELREAALKVMIKDLEQKKGARLRMGRTGPKEAS